MYEPFSWLGITSHLQQLQFYSKKKIGAQVSKSLYKNIHFRSLVSHVFMFVLYLLTLENQAKDISN